MRRLSEVVDFEVLLARDEDLALREGEAALLVRDRALAPQLEKGPPHRRLRAWVFERRARETDLPGDRAAGIIALFGWVLAGLGALSGTGAASALLVYDGRSPVNVLAWLLYAAFVPFILGVVLLVGLLLPKRWFPRAGVLQALLGAVLEPLLSRLPQGSRWATDLFGRTGKGALGRWLFVGLSQLFMAALLGAMLVTLLVKVAVTDLTFAWSTTLELSDADVTAVMEGLALPWTPVYPEAVPTERMVSESNYRRFVERFRDSDERRPVDIATGAMWWRFSAAALVTYGLLPRLFFLLLALFRWKAALRRWPALDRPDVSALLERFEAPHGAFTARSAPKTRPKEEAPSKEGPKAAPPPTALQEEAPLAVAWGAAAKRPEVAARVLKVPPERVLSAGADLDLHAEQAVLTEAAQRGKPVTVLLPLSEPPIEDVLGFLRELRTVAPRVIVVPLELDGEGWRAAPTDAVWTRALAKVRGVEASSS